MTNRVGIVDDSLLVRKTLAKIIQSESNFEVVFRAADPFEAREQIFENDPDILTLDVQLPRLDGITFLKRIMEHKPMPVIMVSSLTTESSAKGIEALEAGAVGIVGKPSGDTRGSLKSMEEDLMRELKAASEAEKPLGQSTKHSSGKGQPLDITVDADGILIGASTGGTSVVRGILNDLKTGLPPILVTQHMPAVFTQQFAEGLDQSADLDVWEAEKMDRVQESECVIAPGDRHMEVRRVFDDRQVTVSLNDEEEIHHQKPAVDYLFNTAAKNGSNWVALVLTGMGKDGRDGARSLSDVGAQIFTQNEASCSVYGMPRQVAENVPQSREISLAAIPPTLNQLSSGS